MGNSGSLRKAQILVKAPALLVLFMGLGALAVDTGFYHLKKAQVQSAAEACAFAAGYRSATGYDNGSSRENLETATADLAELNAPGCDAPVYEWGRWTPVSYSGGTAGFVPVPGTEMASALRVTVRMTCPRFLGAIFGAKSVVLKGQATVVWTPYGNVWPMTVNSRTYMPPNGTIVFGPDSVNIAPGNKGWLSFSGSNNVPDLEVYLNGGVYGAGTPSPYESLDALNQVSSHAFVLQNGNVGAAIAIKGTPGLKAGAKDEVEAYVNAQMIVLVPIWDTVAGQGQDAIYKVVGVVPVQLIEFTPGRDGLRVEGRVLPDGPYWFGPNSNISLNLQERFAPWATLTMVE